MARVYGLDESHCAPGLRSNLSNLLRMYDEALVLPQAHRSAESGAIKNVVMRLNATEGGLSPEVFSPNWFSGVSAVVVDSKIAENLLQNPEKRAELLQRLAESIPSEMFSAETTVGPDLQGDENDRDEKHWIAGFDAPGCCVGLYSAAARRSPDSTKSGISREHKVFFLVCKAGGGLAAQTFHSRITAALKKGLSLEEALAPGAEPGAQALRRVGSAAKRNRARILNAAAETLGFFNLNTVGDTSTSTAITQYRLAITDIDVSTNVLKRLESPGNSHLFQYCGGCIDADASHGVICASNAAEGFIVFSSAEGGFRTRITNEAFNTVPFASERIKNNRDIVMEAAESLKRGEEHPDGKWIYKRFAWCAKVLKSGFTMIPPPLSGSYESEKFSSIWMRELGLGHAFAIRLKPEVVAIAATEAAKLRAASRHVLGH